MDFFQVSSDLFYAFRLNLSNIENHKCPVPTLIKNAEPEGRTNYRSSQYSALQAWQGEGGIDRFHGQGTKICGSGVYKMLKSNNFFLRRPHEFAHLWAQIKLPLVAFCTPLV